MKCPSRVSILEIGSRIVLQVRCSRRMNYNGRRAAGLQVFDENNDGMRVKLNDGDLCVRGACVCVWSIRCAPCPGISVSSLWYGDEQSIRDQPTTLHTVSTEGSSGSNENALRDLLVPVTLNPPRASLYGARQGSCCWTGSQGCATEVLLPGCTRAPR